MVVWRENPTSSKEKACPNMKKDQSKWYSSTKMRSEMIMPRCKLISLRSIANERIMPQYKVISKMTKLHYMLSQVSVSWSNHLKNMSTMMRRLCSYNHIKEITQSYLVLQCERNLITSKEQLCLKNHHRLIRVCPCVRYTRWNIPIMSHAPMWKMTSDLLWRVAMP